LDGLNDDDDKACGEGLDALRDESDTCNEDGIEIGLDAVE
jgi:hypothetical protein